MSITNPFSSSSSSGMDSGSNSSSADVKAAIIHQLQTETAMANARSLIQKISENCFDKCIPSPPGSSLSSKEQTCLNNCMAKYISFWNTTSRSYIERIGRESEQSGAAALGGIAAGTENML